MPPPDAIPDRYQVLETLRESSDERLYLAKDSILDKEVLLKLSGEVATRFGADAELRGAQMLAKVEHPGVARLLGAERTDAGLLLVMEPVAGVPLSLRLRTGAMEEAAVIRLGRQLCDALHAVHREGVVHRGLSPDAVLLKPDGQALLTGFSFAKQSGGAGMSSIDYRRDQDEAAAGPPTPAYPAPEQLAGHRADARSDVYGLGKLLLRCVLGVDGELDAMGRLVGGSGGPVPGGASVPGPQLRAVLQQATARSPLARFPTAAAFGEALAGDGGTAKPTPGRRNLLLIGAAAGLLLAGAGAWAAWDGRDPADQASEQQLLVDQRLAGPQAAGGAAARGEGLAPRYGRSVALLFGVGNYPNLPGDQQLTGPLDDVQILGDALARIGGDHGWAIQPFADPTKEEMLQAISEVAGSLQPDDRLLVYFAGHGFREHESVNDQTGWIQTRDFDGDKQSQGRILFDELRKRVLGCRAKHKLLLLDCCFAGMGADRGTSIDLRGRTAGDLTGYQVELQRKVGVVIAATPGDQQTPDGLPGEGSPFCRAICKVLTPVSGEANPVMDHDRFFVELSDAVRVENPSGVANGLRPVRYQEGNGAFLFILRGPK